MGTLETGDSVKVSQRCLFFCTLEVHEALLCLLFKFRVFCCSVKKVINKEAHLV